MDSEKEWGDPPENKIIKRLRVDAEDAHVDDYDLVASVEVHHVDGRVELPVEVYRMPFPGDLALRKAILRAIRDQPKFWRA